jgi:hypothetical protein
LTKNWCYRFIASKNLYKNPFIAKQALYNGRGLLINKKLFRTAAFVWALLFSVVFGMHVANIAKANPWLLFKEATPILGTIPPIITLSSPQNNSVYASNDVFFSLNVSKPQPPMPLEAGISYVRYTLDGTITALYFCDHYSSGSPPGIPEFNYSHNLTIPEGKHTLVVYASGVVLPGNMTIFWVDSNSTVFFSVGPPQSESELLQSPSPAPSQEPTPLPETQQLEPQPFSTAIVAIASGASVAAVGAGLAVYLRKHNSTG